ncbi:hypothetical protein Tco_1369081 [Tanacetum coccineum]
MVQTRNSDNNNPPDPISTQLAAIAAKLEAIETMKEDIAALKEGDRSRSKGSKNFDGESSWRGRQSYRPYNKIDFPNFSGGDPRGWLLKAEKYFSEYYFVGWGCHGAKSGFFKVQCSSVFMWDESMSVIAGSYGYVAHGTLSGGKERGRLAAIDFCSILSAADEGCDDKIVHDK